MKELITITKQVVGEDEINAVDARELHEFLEVESEFRVWILRRIKNYDFVEGVDFVEDDQKRLASKTGQIRKEYTISLDMAKELSMVERNAKGKEARKYFIECERKAKEVLTPVLPDFNDPIIAARAWADAKEQEQLLEAKIKKSQSLRKSGQFGRKK